MHTVFALLCFVVVIHWLIFPHPSGLLHWHCGNLTIAPVPAKQPWWIWINTPCEFIMNDCITTTKQSTTKPCAYFLGYTVCAGKPQVNKGFPIQRFGNAISFSMFWHYNDVIMGAIASQITSLTIVFSTVYLDTDQRKHQSSASLAFVRGIHRRPVNSPHKWPVTRKMFPFDDVIMVSLRLPHKPSTWFLMNTYILKYMGYVMHYGDVIMGAMAIQITSLTIV